MPPRTAKFILHALAGIFLLTAAACRSLAPLPPVDLSQPGWQIRTGQAIWRPDRGKPEIVGDLIVAIHETDGAYIQFSKAFPIVSGRLRADGWEIEFPPQDKRYAAPGKPPRRIVWLQLLQELRGGQPAPAWRISSSSENDLAMENPSSGERLEVHF